jgi:4-diphosphocytidyl-2-C-methyl-D-erythritol kinase
LADKLQAMEILAPAKINLSLRITGRRDDGYHEVETFIAPVSVADELTLEHGETGKGIQFQCDDPSLPAGDDNLVVRAARGFFETTNIPADVRIALRKKIPHGAGLGGGSSDAASALIALNQFFQTNLPREALAELGAKIGSDVPFFIFDSAAICRGRGELVSPQRLADRLSLLLLKPGFAVTTATAYGAWKKSRELPGISYAPQQFRGHIFVNDLERPVFEKFVFLAQLKTWLLGQPEVGAALMSGSGSTMFAVLKENSAAAALAERVRAELDPKLWIFAGHTC